MEPTRQEALKNLKVPEGGNIVDTMDELLNIPDDADFSRGSQYHGKKVVLEKGSTYLNAIADLYHQRGQQFPTTKAISKQQEDRYRKYAEDLTNRWAGIKEYRSKNKTQNPGGNP